MSTIRTNAILDSAGGNTAQINGITVALASQAQAEAGTDNTKLMTPLRVKQSFRQPDYTGAEVVLPGIGAAATWLHGLAATPKLVQIYARVTTAIGGYAVGDIIPLVAQAGETGVRGWGTWQNATEIGIRMGTSGPFLYNKGTGAVVDARGSTSLNVGVYAWL